MNDIKRLVLIIVSKNRNKLLNVEYHRKFLGVEGISGGNYTQVYYTYIDIDQTARYWKINYRDVLINNWNRYVIYNFVKQTRTKYYLSKNY